MLLSEGKNQKELRYSVRSFRTTFASLKTQNVPNSTFTARLILRFLFVLTLQTLQAERRTEIKRRVLKSDFGFPPRGFSQISFTRAFLSLPLASKCYLRHTHRHTHRHSNIIFSRKLGRDTTDHKMLRQRDLEAELAQSGLLLCFRVGFTRWGAASPPK